MARPLHQIGEFTFPLLKGTVPPYRQTIEVIERKGTSDLLRRKTGVQSTQFQLESIDNLASFDVAQARELEFLAAIESGALILVKDDFNYFSENRLVVVLDVEPTVKKQRAVISGGFDGALSGFFELRASWRLRFVNVF